MAVARIDLADAASPERLVTEILKHEPQLSIPVPIEQLCTQLDIVEIKPLTTPGFEGALLTDADKHSGIILTTRRASRSDGVSPSPTNSATSWPRRTSPTPKVGFFARRLTCCC
jgi:hypothetical protein